MRFETPRHVLKLMAFGATSFWFPDTLWHAVRRGNFDHRDVMAITVLMPCTLLATYALIKTFHKNEPGKSVGWPMMLGVWLLGGLFMVGGWSFAGGGFADPRGISGALGMLLLSLLPPCLWMMSTYDGSLGALIIASFVALLVWAVTHRHADTPGVR